MWGLLLPLFFLEITSDLKKHFLCDLLEAVNYSHTKSSIFDSASILNLFLI